MELQLNQTVATPSLREAVATKKNSQTVEIIAVIMHGQQPLS